MGKRKKGRILREEDWGLRLLKKTPATEGEKQRREAEQTLSPSGEGKAVDEAVKQNRKRAQPYRCLRCGSSPSPPESLYFFIRNEPFTMRLYAQCLSRYR